MIVKRGNKFQLISRKSDRALGTHDTAREAHAQEAAIQRNMEQGGEIGDPPKLNEMFFATFPEEPGQQVREEPQPKEDDWYQTLLDRQRYKESRFNPMAESPAGARGLAQIMPGTEQYLKERGLIRPDFDAFNPEHSVEAQEVYMESLMGRDWNRGNDEVKAAKALAAYNFGPTATVRILNEAKEKGIDIYNSLDWIEMLPLETSDYISKILGYNDRFEREYSEARSSSAR